MPRPTTSRVAGSPVAARCSQPSPVGRWPMSASRTVSGRSATRWRSSRFGATGGSWRLPVVRGGRRRPRRACGPISRTGRATRRRECRRPSRRGAAWTRREPQARRRTAKVRPIRPRSPAAASARARVGGIARSRAWKPPTLAPTTRRRVATAWSARPAATSANSPTRSPGRRRPRPSRGSRPPPPAARSRASAAAARPPRGRRLRRARGQALVAPRAQLAGAQPRPGRDLAQPLAAVQQPLWPPRPRARW